MIIIKIGIIGAGKVGFSVGKYLKNKNIEVIGYFSRSENSSLEASLFTNTKNYLDLKSLVKESDTIIISTPDAQIKEVWNQIKEMSIKNKIICHLSGSLSSNIFSNINEYGAYAYSIHPMYPINDKYNSYKDLNDAFITIEGNEEYINYVESFIKKLGNKTKIIRSHDKSLYHASSVIVSNLFIGLMSISIDSLKKYGFKEEEAIKALYPLINSNIRNINEYGLINSLTGPIERSDYQTILNHISKLEELDSKEIYVMLSKKILNLAKEKNKDRDYMSLEKLLGGKDKDEEYSSNI